MPAAQLMALMAEMALTAGIGGGPISPMVGGGARLVPMTDCSLEIADDGGWISAIMDDRFCIGDRRPVLTH